MSSDHDELRRMREEVDELSGPTMPPQVTEAANRARAAASSARDVAGDRISQLSEQVQDRPFLGVLVAAGLGYLLARYVVRA